MRSNRKNKPFLTVREIALFGMLGGVMYASKALMASLPNIHLIAVFIVSLTVVYRAKALFPTYIYIFLEGVFGGFTAWWIPYLYIWAILWGVTMLLPKRMKTAAEVPVYAVTAGLHGLLFGTLFAPAQALFFGLDLKGMLAWIAAGFPYDVTHAISNFVLGLVLIVPLIRLFRYIEARGGGPGPSSNIKVEDNHAENRTSDENLR